MDKVDFEELKIWRWDCPKCLNENEEIDSDDEDIWTRCYYCMHPVELVKKEE